MPSYPITYRGIRCLTSMPNPAEAAGAKPRAKRFTGKVSQFKKWICEQQRGPGFFLPIRVFNEANERAHWATKASRTRMARNYTSVVLRAAFVHEELRNACRRITRLPATITLTRYGPRRMDDDGNQRALKAVRDGVADAFGTNDGPDSGLTFEYGQEVEKFYGVRITIIAALAGKECP